MDPIPPSKDPPPPPCCAGAGGGAWLTASINNKTIDEFLVVLSWLGATYLNTSYKQGLHKCSEKLRHKK